MTRTIAAPRRTIALVLLTVLASISAACGARVSESQVQAAGGAVGGTGATASGAGANGAGAADAGTGATGAAAGGSSATAGSGATGGGAAASGGATATGDNGGATDVGVTATQVLLGNVSTLSGPVPGLFQGAVVGAQAVVAYQNSLGGLFGRKFKLDARDDQFDTGQNRSATVDLTKKAFGMLGSFSLYDDAGKDAVVASGMPDATYSLTSRRDDPNNFSIEPAKVGGAPLSPFNYFGKKFPAEVKAVGTIYGDVASSKQSADAYMSAAKSVGWNFVYQRGAQATETDFTADVIRMRSSGVKLVYLGSVDDKTLARILKALDAQGFKVPVVTTGVGYAPTIPSLAGSAAEGLWTWAPYSLFGGEDAAAIPEVKLMDQWVQKVKPGFVPDLYTAFAWAEGRLLFQAMQKAGPKAKRADVVAALKTFTNFSDENLIAPAGPGTKTPPTCGVISQIKGGKFVRIEPAAPAYKCDDGGYHVG